MKHAGAAIALAATLGAWGLPAARATEPTTAQALAAAACAGSAAMPSAPADVADFETLLRADPPAALAWACAQRAAPRAGMSASEAALSVGEGLLVNGRLDASRAVLEAALAEAEALQPAQPALLGRVHIALGTLAHETGDGARSAAGFERARAALQAAGATRSRAFAAVLVGQAAGWNHRRQPGDLERADAALDEAGALLGSLGLGDTRQMGDVLNIRSVVAHARSDLPGAVRWARAEIALMQRIGLGDDPELLHALTTVGALQSQLGQFDDAEAALREGLRIIEGHPESEPAGQLGVLNNLAALHQDRGDFPAALPVAERALALAQRVYGPGAARTLTPLTVRANVERNLVLYAASRRSFEAALAVASAHAAAVGPLRRLRLYEGYAAVLQSLGDNDAARAALAEAQRIVGAGDANFGYWQGRILRSSAKLAARAGDWSASDARNAQAMNLIGAVIGPRHPYVVALLAERCVAQVRGPLPGEACDELQAQLDDLRTAAPGFRFNAFAALAIAAESQGRLGEARERHLQALAAATSAGGADPLWSAHDALAVHLRANGERRLAIVAAKQAVEQIELMRRELGADARRLERGFLADKLGVYRHLADWLAEDGRIDEALGVLRLLKQEEFNDYVRGEAVAGDSSAPQRLRTPRDAPLLDAWDRLRESSAGTAAAPAEARTEAEREAQRQWANRRAEAESARVAAWREFLAAHAQAGAVQPESLPPGRAPGDVAAGTLRVWAFPGVTHLNLVLDSRAQRELVRVAFDGDTLARSVGRLLADIGRREPVQAQLQALHAAVGAPIEGAARRAGAKRIELQLDGVLRYLPFAALYDGRRYLGERYTIEQRVEALAAGAPATPRSAQTSAAPTMLRAVGVTRALGGMAPLSAIAGEVCGIVDGPVRGLDAGDSACAATGQGRGALPGMAWLNDEFTARRLTLAAGEGRAGHRDLLHMGTHFVLRPGHMRRSWLLLGDGQRLYLDELARMSFAGQDLVTLSACETGVGGAAGGDGSASGQEIDGLNTLVMRRGAAAVLASLWSVEDGSTSALMLALYRELGQHADPATALARAQAAVRTSAGGARAHPFHWAGFYLASGGR